MPFPLCMYANMYTCMSFTKPYAIPHEITCVSDITFVRSISSSSVALNPIHCNQSTLFLWTIMSPRTTGSHQSECVNTVRACVSPPNLLKRHAARSQIAFGTRLVSANDHVVSPENGTSVEQMPVRRMTCRSATSRFFRGSSTASMRYPPCAYAERTNCARELK